MTFGAWQEAQANNNVPYGYPGRSPRICPWVQSTALTDGTSTSIAATAPVGIMPGDLLLAVCATRDDASSQWVPPTGWTNLVPVYAAGGSGGGRRIAWKIANNDDARAATFTFATVGNNNNEISLVCVRGVEQSTLGGYRAGFGGWCAGITSRYWNERSTGISGVPQVCVPDADCLVLACASSSTANNAQHPVFTWGAPFVSISAGGSNRTGVEWAQARPGPARGGVFPRTAASISMASGGGPTNTEHVTTICIRGRLRV